MLAQGESEFIRQQVLFGSIGA